MKSCIWTVYHEELHLTVWNSNAKKRGLLHTRALETSREGSMSQTGLSSCSA